MRSVPAVVSIIAVAGLGCGTAPSPVAPPLPVADPLVGLWGAELDFDVGPRGELRIAGTPAHARLGDIDAPLVESAGELTGAVGTGAVRLRRTPDGLTGFWIQPRTVADPAYASPLAFVRDPDGGLRATVAPRPATVHVFVAIRSDGGRLRAFVREPGHNLRFGELAVAHAGAAVDLRGAGGDVVMRGELAGERLHLAITGMDIALDFTRRGRDAAPEFYPRPANDPGRVAPVADLADGWRVGTPEAAGLDRAPLDALVRSIADAVPTGPASPAVHAVAIARRGVLVVDEYFAGDRADAVHDLRSAGKSFTSTLAGIAIDRGALSLDTPLYAGLGVAPDDPRKAAIQLRHLLAMASGLACDDHDPSSPGNEDRLQQQADWVGYALALPIAHAPGEHPAYCSGTMNLVGALVAGPRHGWLPERLHADVMAPLGIAHYYVNLQPDGQGYSAGGLQLRLRDFAKLAQLFLDHGTWRGTRVVGASWVDDAIAAHASLNHPDDYGYGWWRITYHVGDRAYDAFYASGNGGQLAIAIPSLDLVIAFNGGSYNNFAAWRPVVEELVPRYVIAAVRR